MQVKEIVGIDVSKLTLDGCIHSVRLPAVFDNSWEGIESLVAWSLANSEHEPAALMFVFEHTGLYSKRLIQYLAHHGYKYHVASGLSIKRSLGVIRGKDDKADARRIALYGYRLREELEPSKVPNSTLDQLKHLMSLRLKFVSQRSGSIVRLGEQSLVLERDSEPVLFEAQESVIAVLDVEIAKIEAEMNRLISEDQELQTFYQLITSIKGVGEVTARFMIVYTMGFTKFDNWRKFASYCGIAPFPNQSGTSIRGRTKVSHLANKQGKTLLNMCASSAIQYNKEMKAYFERRVAQGKNKMSTLNIVRNKLLARIFAVVNRRSPYVDIMRHAS